VTQYILGIQPEYSGLRIDPCIPSDWKEIKITRRFRKKNLNITILNSSHVQKGVKKITINGREIEGNLIPLTDILDTNEVFVQMG
jgi:cellobiose phosphorylase